MSRARLSTCPHRFGGYDTSLSPGAFLGRCFPPIHTNSWRPCASNQIGTGSYTDEYTSEMLKRNIKHLFIIDNGNDKQYTYYIERQYIVPLYHCFIIVLFCRIAQITFNSERILSQAKAKPQEPTYRYVSIHRWAFVSQIGQKIQDWRHRKAFPATHLTWNYSP